MKTIAKIRIFIVSTILALSCQHACASGQVSDVLIWDGVEYDLLDLPLYLNDELEYAFAKKYEVTSPHTANIRGYQAFWSVRDNALYLDSILYCTPDYQELMLNVADDALFDAFKTEKGVKASWVTQALHMGMGDLVYYDHFGFSRTYEHEVGLQFEAGTLTRTFHTDYSWDSTDVLTIHSEGLEQYIAAMFPKKKGSMTVRIVSHDNGNDKPVIKYAPRTSKAQKVQEVEEIGFCEEFLRKYNINSYLLESGMAYMTIQLGI